MAGLGSSPSTQSGGEVPRAPHRRDSTGPPELKLEVWGHEEHIATGWCYTGKANTITAGSKD